MTPSSTSRTTRLAGVSLALLTATISGVSIYLNGFAVKHFADATVYTTAKNVVAGLVLVALVLALKAALGERLRDTRLELSALRRPRRLAPLVLLAVLGGSVPFVLFFEGLKRAEATQASFIQKTLVVWVALLAWPLLKERARLPHLAAIGLLVLGQAWLVGSAGTIAWGPGETMILGATLLWALEVVYVKRLLTDLPSGLLALGRMVLGSALLLAWVAASGKWATLVALDWSQWRWVLLSGLLLAGYVASWYAALARAQAVDVTAMLVVGALVTAGLAGTLDGAHVSAAGAALIALGSGLVTYLAARRPAAHAAAEAA